MRWVGLRKVLAPVTVLVCYHHPLADSHRLIIVI